jgi:hypothetical protein
MSTITTEQKINSCSSTMTVNRVYMSRHNLLARQIGQVLLSLGALFIYLPPFNDHIDENTGQLLISLGRKLRTTK